LVTLGAFFSAFPRPPLHNCLRPLLLVSFPPARSLHASSLMARPVDYGHVFVTVPPRPRAFLQLRIFSKGIDPFSFDVLALIFSFGCSSSAPDPLLTHDDFHLHSGLLTPRCLLDLLPPSAGVFVTLIFPLSSSLDLLRAPKGA